MGLSGVILICCISMLLLGLLHCFFGYKLARFLLPVSGLVLTEGVLYIFVFDQLKLDSVSTWLFFVGSGVAVYLILFFLKRIAGFFTGLFAGGLLAVFLVFVLGLQTMPLVYPASLTICVMTGLFTLVYHRSGVVIATAIAGGCAAAFGGFYLFLAGVDAANLTAYDNLLVPLERFLGTNANLVGGAALVLAAVGIFVQFYWTAGRQLLTRRSQPERNAHSRNGFADSV